MIKEMIEESIACQLYASFSCSSFELLQSFHKAGNKKQHAVYNKRINLSIIIETLHLIKR